MVLPLMESAHAQEWREQDCMLLHAMHCLNAVLVQVMHRQHTRLHRLLPVSAITAVLSYMHKVPCAAVQ